MEIIGLSSERQKEQSMEISFEGREAVVYREFAYLTRRTQETAESVVPDTEADIQKIAAVHSGVILKSKDLSSRGVTVSGEMYANILYIPEGEAGVNGIRVRRTFTLDFETEGPEFETLAQVSLLLQGTDVRTVNPRKVSVSFDVEGQLCCYRSESLCVDAALPENAGGLHAKMEEHTLVLPNAVCEKGVAVNEQFSFTDDETGITLEYSLYIPEGYDGSEEYPLVMFIPDSTGAGLSSSEIVENYYGAAIWAGDEDQEKHPSFVRSCARLYRNGN